MSALQIERKQYFIDGKQYKRNWFLYPNFPGKFYYIPLVQVSTIGLKVKKFRTMNISCIKKTLSYLLTDLQKMRIIQKLFNYINEKRNTYFWKNILERLVEVFNFLSSRGFPLRGRDSYYW
ncbi:unnamed protein product [Psylliodes chrysocephalus]|uniref:Uncharacterized protein n=1 Tax=Psylliodes chrysocephalus TaxID=3402493 RepID=A0A9P0D774_9CUCU|nr:unnamed protein product [Psylliodes chrysocephala]